MNESFGKLDQLLKRLVYFILIIKKIISLQ